MILPFLVYQKYYSLSNYTNFVSGQHWLNRTSTVLQYLAIANEWMYVGCSTMNWNAIRVIPNNILHSSCDDVNLQVKKSTNASHTWQTNLTLCVSATHFPSFGI